MYPESPRHQPQQPAAPLDVKQGALVAGAAMAVTAVLLVSKWLLMFMFGGAGVLLAILAVVCAGTYLWFRMQNPQQMRAIEASLLLFIRTTATQLSTMRGGTPQPQAPTQAYPTANPYRTAATPTPTSPYQATAQLAPTTNSDGLISVLLLIPSLLAYGVYSESTSFSSVWQPWWIMNGLNLFFVACAATRARSAARRTAALLPGIAGLILAGLASSPSTDVTLFTIFSTKQGYGTYSYMAPPEDLVPWLNRAPALAIMLFVIAWGIARREGNWVFGLIPAGFLLWWSVWYQEHEFTGEAGWIGYWGMNVGIFIGGCLVCWAVDSMTTRRSVQPTSQWPR